jgi:carboxypeptidase C (cathepsin A)
MMAPFTQGGKMRYFRFLMLIGLLAGFALHAHAQQDENQSEEISVAKPSPSAAKPSPAGKKDDKTHEEKDREDDKPPVVTHHEIRMHGTTLKYTATTGMMPIADDDGTIEAHIFFIAYTLDNPPAGSRPLTFCFNGGPGSSSVWLHMGAIGPRKVKLKPDGDMPRPPFELEDNQSTWLDQTDLVFIDPVGTGYSRATKKEYGKKFWSVGGDVASVGQFIRLYLSRYERWMSPLFLAGESYGTTRAAGLSGFLINNGIAVNGIVLVSTVLNFETLEFTQGNDMPYILYLPSYTATAWYHKKLSPELAQQDVAKILPEVEQWATNEYALALAKGDLISPSERQSVVDHLARYTGLPKTTIDQANLRVKGSDFAKELLRDQNRTVGRLDSRFKGIDEPGISQSPDYDPSEAIIRPPFTSVFNNYVRADLGYKTDRQYYILGGGFREWDFGPAENGFPNVSPQLRSAFVKNQYMKVFVAEGYYDLATPYYAVEYTLAHLGLDSELLSHITKGRFEAGHMVYIERNSLDKLKQDVAAFMQSALK